MTVNPHMLVLAREAAGATQASVAQASAVSQAQLSKFEHGLDEPSEALLASLASQYAVPVSFFEQPDAVLGEGVVDFFHRKRATLPAKPLRRAQAQVNVVRLESMRLMRDVELTDVSLLPSLGQHSLSPAEAADFVRRTWRVPQGPLPDLVGLLESAGVPIFLMDLGHEKLSAITMPGMEGRPIIVLNSTQSPSMQRFSLAHELGHLVLHDGSYTPAIEDEADQFAAELLMPAADISHQLEGLRFRDLGGLKTLWRVSMSALIYRAKALGFLTERQARTFWIQRNKLPGAPKREPGEFDRETPRLMAKIAAHYVEEMGLTTEELARLAVVDHETLLRRYFGKESVVLRSVGRAPLFSVSTQE